MSKAKGMLLRFARKACGVSKSEMSMRMEINEALLIRIEHGKMSITDKFIERWVEELTRKNPDKEAVDFQP